MSNEKLISVLLDAVNVLKDQSSKDQIEIKQDQMTEDEKVWSILHSDNCHLLWSARHSRKHYKEMIKYSQFNCDDQIAKAIMDAFVKAKGRRGFAMSSHRISNLRLQRNLDGFGEAELWMFSQFMHANITKNQLFRAYKDGVLTISERDPKKGKSNDDALKNQNALV